MADDPGPGRAMMDTPAPEPTSPEPTDLECRAAINAMRHNRIAAIHQGGRITIRDMSRPDGQQDLWQCPDNLCEDLSAQSDIERMRLALKAAAIERARAQAAQG